MSVNLFTTSNILDIKNHLLPIPPGMKRRVWIDFDDTLTMTGVQDHVGGPRWRSDFRQKIKDLTASGRVHPKNNLFDCITLFIAKAFPAKAVQGSDTAEMVRLAEAEESSEAEVFTARGIKGPKAWYDRETSGVDGLTKGQQEQAGITFKTRKTSINHPNIYSNHLIFCQNKPKDDVIDKLFKDVFKASETFQFIFIDDKKDSVVAVIKKASEDLKIAHCVGIHYKRVEEIEKDYNGLRATIQLVKILASQTLFNKEELEKEEAKIKNHGIKPEDYINKVLTTLDQVLSKPIYEDKTLSVDQIYERMKHACAPVFNNWQAWLLGRIGLNE